ncbi:putative PI phosphatase group protein-like protein [Tricladium varicosporioides]|nr:putative PI phosphatase group protein-like protein [Hymenoscyphus varicosporioides]
MANAKPTNNSAPRAVSPKPNGTLGVGTGDLVRNLTGRQESIKTFAEADFSARGRERELVETGLRPFRIGSSANVSPSPTRGIRAKPTVTIPPSVTIQAPQSPPKGRSLNINLPSASSYLSTDVPLSAASGGSSPRHFRIPSRPHTPLLEPRKSPSLPSSQPPSPPPPRRSGELKRESSFKPLPPPVNRAEKPKIGNKPISLGFRTEATTLAPIPTPNANDRSSPFNTPPSSGSSPDHEIPAPLPQRPRPKNPPDSQTLIPANQRVMFEPPPVHHSVVNRRKDQEMNGTGRTISPQVTGEQRPALPTRPQASSEIAPTRNVSQVSLMPPPPPRPSVDRTRPVVNTSVPPETQFSTPPKRVFSTPTSQLQTPPRSHGRSMTVDRTSDRTPAEFRTPLQTPIAQEPRKSLDIASSILPGSNAAEYPDSSHSNRRPPYFKQGAHEISTRYDTRIVDVCGEFVCTSGHLTRVWSLLDGELVMSLAHTEGIKVVSVMFKPMADVKDEGTRLWLGNNIGELIEVDVPSQSVVSTKSNAHTRREVIKLYRHVNEMWTLDDGGTLHVWGADNTGAPNLTNPHASFRVPKGHTFSMVVGDELWHAVGKDIRVFVPTVNSSAQFQVHARPLGQQSAGEITSGTTLTSQSDKVYFGHTDGKVSIYSRNDYACLGIVNISVYKITTLAGAGGKLWAGFSTGMIYIYDTTQTPWAVKKDFRAHQDPVIKLVSDRSSYWSLDRAQVISLGQDNAVRIWDGSLQDDWIETHMQSSEADFCAFQSVKALIMTWNAGAATPSHLRHSGDADFFRDLLQSSDLPDILVFGFQELVDLEDKTRTAKSFFKSKKKDPHSEQEHMSHQYRDWRDYLTRSLDEYMPRNELYHLLHTSTLVGLFTCIFIRAPLRDRIRSVSAAEVKRGMGGLHGNKGAIVVRFALDDSSFCFINCHLAAGQSQTKDRNNDITSILESSILPAERDHSVRQDSYIGGGDGTMILDHEICILNGDLNYRIDTMGRDTVINAVKANNLTKLLERDQLLASKRKNPWFKLRAFQEMAITFPPTYKYDVGTDNYDTSEKKRSPAWCDRILSRGRDRISQIDYKRHEVRVSDHRPVTAQFDIVTKSISPKRRAMKWDDCQKQWLQTKEKQAYEAKLDYLSTYLGFDATASKKLILQNQKTR